MKTKLQLQIPEPCKEDWDMMSPLDKGRFCFSCQKQVVDFTGMSDEQLFSFFRKKGTGSVCGRFLNDQLERDIIMQGKRIPWLKYFVQLVLPIFLTSMRSQAQGQVLLKKSTEIFCTNTKTEMNSCKTVPVQKNMNYITGKVVDEAGVGIPYASVMIRGTHTGTACDSSGNFKLSYAASDSVLTLVVSCVGYSVIEKEIDPDNDLISEIILSSSPILYGDVYITSTILENAVKGRVGGVSIVSKYTNWGNVMNWFGNKKDTARVYPNPVLRSQTIHIEFTGSTNQRILVSLLATDGKPVYEKYTEVTKGKYRFSIPADSKWTAGIYFLQITNEKGKIKSEKLIVQ